MDALTLYDALELSFNSIGKASVLKTNNVDILQSIHTKAVSNDVYNKSDIGIIFSSLIGAAPAELNTSVELATDVGNDFNYARKIQNKINTTSHKANNY